MEDHETSITSHLPVARGYSRIGWAIFPLWWTEADACGCGSTSCRSQGKHPIGHLAPNGCLDATTNRATIEQWWAGYPDANIGIATGEASGIVVIDVDDDHGGYTSWDRLTDRHGDPGDTWTVVTGSGGAHLYFQHPPQSVRCSAGMLGPGLDVRAAGGYVVAPPSMHKSGSPYRWEATAHPKRCPMQPLPPWLLERMTGSRDVSREALVVLGPIPDGQRDVTLTSFAGSMRRRGMSHDAILAALQVENRTRCQPPLPHKDVQRIAWSISRDQYAPPKIATVSVAS